MVRAQESGRGQPKRAGGAENQEREAQNTAAYSRGEEATAGQTVQRFVGRRRGHAEKI